MKNNFCSNDWRLYFHKVLCVPYFPCCIVWDSIWLNLVWRVQSITSLRWLQPQFYKVLSVQLISDSSSNTQWLRKKGRRLPKIMSDWNWPLKLNETRDFYNYLILGGHLILDRNLIYLGHLTFGVRWLLGGSNRYYSGILNTIKLETIAKLV